MKNFSLFMEEKEESAIEFFEKRKAGAMKIAANAKKSGPGILTYWHFTAKEQPYNEVLKAIKENKPKKHFVNECKKLLKEIDVENLGQKEFQELMGKLEVFGETFIKIK